MTFIGHVLKLFMAYAWNFTDKFICYSSVLITQQHLFCFYSWITLFGYVKWRHVSAAGLGKAVPMSFHKLMFSYTWNNVKNQSDAASSQICIRSQPVSSCYGCESVLMLLSRCCSTIPGSFHWRVCSLLLSQPLLSQIPPEAQLMCILRGIWPWVNSAPFSVIKIKLLCSQQ